MQMLSRFQKVSEINPEIRIRFTSPHPKDFPDEVLGLIKEKPNICKQLHLPAQSGNSRILVKVASQIAKKVKVKVYSKLYYKRDVSF